MNIPIGYSLESYEPPVLNANEIGQNKNVVQKAFTERKTIPNNFIFNPQNVPGFNNNLVANNNLLNNNLLNSKMLYNNYNTQQLMNNMALNYGSNNQLLNNNLKNNKLNIYPTMQLTNQMAKMANPNLNLLNNNNNNIFMPLLTQNGINNQKNNMPQYNFQHSSTRNYRCKSSFYSIQPHNLLFNNKHEHRIIYRRNFTKKKKF